MPELIDAVPFVGPLVIFQVIVSPSESVAFRSYDNELFSVKERDNAMFPEEITGEALEKSKSLRIPEWAVQK